ncbi:MAG TPA: 4Fe-4S dicluster domain-containing protein [Chloroflexi bacterium]|nr:4Fe-4S dicluster domain-containing protein [Chloroflexota bacterium]
MDGSGILKGLGVTFKRLIDTYVDDFKRGKKRYYTEEGIEYRRSTEVKGIFTVQYPEEKLPVPEEFRFVPFLVGEEKEDGTLDPRCTACGICTKVCPAQCIWIVRSKDPKTGRPHPKPAEFYIDIDLCMNCGLCAEYCPFDAIKMDHDYELATYDRFADDVLDINKLLKPVSYYAEIRPRNYEREEEARRKAEEAKRKAAEARAKAKAAREAKKKQAKKE